MRRGLAFAGAAIALVDDAVYLVIIHRQGNEPITDGVVVTVAVSIAVAALLTVVAITRLEGTRRRAAVGVAVFMLVVLGLLGIFSIGLPLLVAASLVAASPSGGHSRA